jgi:hypothetical protein
LGDDETVAVVKLFMHGISSFEMNFRTVGYGVAPANCGTSETYA